MAQQGQKKKIAGKNHLNIFEILELFKKVEIRQLMAGRTRRRQAPHQKNEDESIGQTSKIIHSMHRFNKLNVRRNGIR